MDIFACSQPYPETDRQGDDDVNDFFWDESSYVAWVIPRTTQITGDLWNGRYFRPTAVSDPWSEPLFPRELWPDNNRNKRIYPDSWVQWREHSGIVDLHGEIEIDDDELAEDAWNEKGCWYVHAYRGINSDVLGNFDPEFGAERRCLLWPRNHIEGHLLSAPRHPVPD